MVTLMSESSLSLLSLKSFPKIVSPVSSVTILAQVLPPAGLAQVIPAQSACLAPLTMLDRALKYHWGCQLKTLRPNLDKDSQVPAHLITCWAGKANDY